MSSPLYVSLYLKKIENIDPSLKINDLRTCQMTNEHHSQGNAPLVSATSYLHKGIRTNHGNVTIPIRIAYILKNTQWHIKQPELYLIMALPIYLCIRLTFIYFLLYFIVCFPQNNKIWSKGRVRVSHLSRETLPTASYCVPRPQKRGRAMGNIPLWSTPVQGEWGVGGSTSPTIKDASPCNTSKIHPITLGEILAFRSDLDI
jgi:hypothetical protein